MKSKLYPYEGYILRKRVNLFSESRQLIPRATYDEIVRQLDIERTIVRINIDAMKKKAVLRRVGGDKNGHWEVLLVIKNAE